MTAICALRSEGLAADRAFSWRPFSIALLVVDDQAALRATNEIAPGLFFAIDEDRAAAGAAQPDRFPRATEEPFSVFWRVSAAPLAG
jgi:hypothetical protein